MIPQSLYHSVPKKTGVYQFYDQERKLLYVGKALSLNRRVSSYFQAKVHDNKTHALVKHVAYIDFIVTDTEKEALILEHDLIKKFRPTYNILLKDNKFFPYIAFTKEKWSRMTLVRRSYAQIKKMHQHYDFFGPYPDVKSVRQTCELFYQYLGLRSCDDTTFSHRTRGCLKAQIGHCSAPCVANISHDKYLENVAMAKKILTGRSTEMIDELTQQMNQAAEQWDYKSAASFRDFIRSIRRTQSAQTVRSRFEDVDVYIIGPQYESVTVGYMAIRNGCVCIAFVNDFSSEGCISENWDAYQAYLLRHSQGINKAKDTVVFDQYGEVLAWGDPDGVVNRYSKKQLAQWYELLIAQIKLKVRMKQIQVIEPVVLAELGIQRQQPWLVAIDISHMQGSNCVACCASIDLVSQSKRGMQLFRLKDINNDVSAIKEVSQRLAKRWSVTNRFPDCVVIDGGEAQLASASESLSVRTQLYSLAKGPDRVWGQESVYHYSRGMIQQSFLSTAAKAVLCRIRDRAHDTALQYHRKVSQSKMRKSSLQAIEGIGPVKEKTLIASFGGLKGLKLASVKDLTSVKGVDESLAIRIHNALHCD